MPQPAYTDQDQLIVDVWQEFEDTIEQKFKDVIRDHRTKLNIVKALLKNKA